MFLYSISEKKAPWVIEKNISNGIKRKWSSLTRFSLVSGQIVSLGMNQRLDARISKWLIKWREVDIYIPYQVIYLTG